jgi:hypothetical protein
MTYLRRTVAAMVDGFWAGLDILQFGHAYPRHYTIRKPARPLHDALPTAEQAMGRIGAALRSADKPGSGT